MNIIGPHIAKGPTGSTTKNQLNHTRIDLNGLPNTVKNGEISEKQLISALLLTSSPSLKRAAEALPSLKRAAEAMGAEN